MDVHNRPGHRGNRPLHHLATRGRSPTRASDAIAKAACATAIRERMDALAGNDPLLNVNSLCAGYGTKEVLHGIDLRLGAGQLLCVIGPNGAGKSSLLHSIFGLTDIHQGRIEIGGRNVTRLGPNAKLRDAGIAYVLHDSSLFPDMTVEQNLWLGGYLRGRSSDARNATEEVFDRYPALAARRNEPARALSDGEHRLLEIARALVMRPRLLLLDEPATGLTPSMADAVFAMLRDLRNRESLSIMLVESNAKRGLEVADIGCALVGGEIAVVGTGTELLDDPKVVPLCLGS